MTEQESRAAYTNARRRARKHLSDFASTDSKGYLPVLDERIQGIVIVGEINLGYHEIPLSKIVGTKTTARSNSFAGNFMPLLAEDTEFAVKWQNVYRSQLSEGIREPITVYEYINRYYVLEGNKRVSILKFVGAASAYGKIIRLLPERDENNNEISIYYEFLDYDKRSFFDNLWFRKKGNFTRLVRMSKHYLKRHPDLSVDVNTLIKHSYRVFREVYKRLNFNIALTTGDALVEYIKIFGFPYSQEPRLLKKNLKSIQSQLLVAAGVRYRDMIEVSEKEGSLLTIKPSFFKPARKIRAAFAFDGNPNTSLWTRFHTLAIDRVERKYPDLTVDRLFDVPPRGLGMYDAISSLFDNNPDILFTTSPKMSDASLRAALENPSVILLNCDIPQDGKNLHTYYFKLYDLTFLCGILASAMSKTGIIGYMSAADGHSKTYDLNAFAIGARLINPNSRILDYALLRTNDWLEHDRARLSFAHHGADIAFCFHSPDNPLDRKAFPEVYAQLYLIDSAGVPIDSIAAATFNWEPFYDKVISDAILGKSSLLEGHIEGNPIHFGWGFSTGVMDLFTLHDLVGITGRLLRIFRDLMKSGALNPFEGPILDNSGSIRIDWNEVPTLMQIQDIDWLEFSVSRIN